MRVSCLDHNHHPVFQKSLGLHQHALKYDRFLHSTYAMLPPYHRFLYPTEHETRVINTKSIDVMNIDFLGVCEPNLLCAVAPNAISREQNININLFIATL